MKQNRISITPPKELSTLKSKITALAEKEERSLNEYLIRLIENQIKNPKKLFK